MNKRERFYAAIRGAPIDRAPVVAWCNLATDGVDATENARRQLAFHRLGDWDILKVMNDYRLASPPGLDTISSAADLLAFKRRPMTERGFFEQLETLRILRREVGPEVPILDTLLEPFFSACFTVGFSTASLIRSHPIEAASMLDAITATFVDYIGELKRIGVDGVLYATNGCIIGNAARAITDDEYRAFHRPYDLRLLEAMQGLVRIVHAHGNPLAIERVLDYPCEALSWSDRLAGNPSIAAMRQRTTKCVMGGIDESKLFERGLPEVRAEIADALAQSGGPRNFILSPGCNINPGTATRTLRAVTEAARSSIAG
ncbi:MAG: uroporphyrinogen decarboxylase family protein [Burkholderiales bacterium]